MKPDNNSSNKDTNKNFNRKPGASTRKSTGKPGAGRSGNGKPGTSKQGYGKSSRSGSGVSRPSGYKRVEREKQLPNDPAEIKEILGQVSAFKIAKLTPIGAYLSFAGETEDKTLKTAEILLPKNER